MEYIDRLDNYDAPDIANIAIQSKALLMDRVTTKEYNVVYFYNEFFVDDVLKSLLIFFRLKMKFSCMMELNKYPLDVQVCTMEVASCKYIYAYYISYIFAYLSTNKSV